MCLLFSSLPPPPQLLSLFSSSSSSFCFASSCRLLLFWPASLRSGLENSLPNVVNRCPAHWASKLVVASQPLALAGPPALRPTCLLPSSSLRPASLASGCRTPARRSSGANWKLRRRVAAQRESQRDSRQSQLVSAGPPRRRQLVVGRHHRRSLAHGATGGNGYLTSEISGS